MPDQVENALAVDLAGIALSNPIVLAAGTCGTLDEFSEVLPLARVGGVVSKSITRLAREGNAPVRVVGCRAGMLNAIGLANPGIDEFERGYLGRAAGIGTALLVSVAGFSIEDYAAVSGRVDGWAGRGVRGIELNLSCPNVHGGTEFGASAAVIKDLLKEVRPAVRRMPLFVKLSPAAPEMVGIAAAAVEAGADGLTIGNTMPAMAIDVRTRRPRLSNVTGGLSGAAIHPVAVRQVHEVYRKVARDARGKGRGVPIIGLGGVMGWEDAAEFILAGATGVGIGTALFVDPRVPLRVVRGLEKWVRSQGCGSVADLVGAVRLA